MTHLVASEEPGDPANEHQRARFAAACAGLPPAPRSFANSSGIFLGAGWGSDLARPGAALYGINPTPGRPNPMRLPVRLTARILAVRDAATGRNRRLQRHLARHPPVAHRHHRGWLRRRLAPQPVRPRPGLL